jgi:hypothetical protein
MHIQLPSLPAANSIATAALKLLIGAWVLLAVAAVFVMTLGTDEAWVLNGLRSALQPQVPHLSTEMIVTSGGAFALANLAVEWVAGNRVWAHRLVSLLCLGLTFALILRTRGKAAPASIKWLMLAPLIAIPGVAAVGTAALGTATGLFLMIAAMLLWTSPTTSLGVRVIGGGLLYGLAAASRFELVLFGPAVLIASCIALSSSGKLTLRLNLPAWGFAVIGVGVFMLNQWFMSLPANAMVEAHVDSSTGLNGWALNYPKLLNQWATASGFAPLALLVVLAASAFWVAPAAEATARRQTPKLEPLLLITGLILFAAWLFRAPIPHLRYAFPALFCFAVLGSLGLQRLATQSLARGDAGRQWLLCQCIGLACVIGSIGTTTRSLVMSDSDYASWEWTHEMPYDYFRRFEARLDQARVATYLKEQMAPDARLYSYVPYALRYLTGRPVVAIDRPAQPDGAVRHADRYLVLTPAVGTYLHMNIDAANWIEANTRLVKQIGRYSVYQLPAGSDADLANLELSRTNYEHHPGSKLWFGRKGH